MWHHFWAKVLARLSWLGQHVFFVNGELKLLLHHSGLPLHESKRKYSIGVVDGVNLAVLEYKLVGSRCFQHYPSLW